MNIIYASKLKVYSITFSLPYQKQNIITIILKNSKQMQAMNQNENSTIKFVMSENA